MQLDWRELSGVRAEADEFLALFRIGPRIGPGQVFVYACRCDWVGGTSHVGEQCAQVLSRGDQIWIDYQGWMTLSIDRRWGVTIPSFLRDASPLPDSEAGRHQDISVGAEVPSRLFLSHARELGSS